MHRRVLRAIVQYSLGYVVVRAPGRDFKMLIFKGIEHVYTYFEVVESISEVISDLIRIFSLLFFIINPLVKSRGGSS